MKKLINVALFLCLVPCVCLAQTPRFHIDRVNVKSSKRGLEGRASYNITGIGQKRMKKPILLLYVLIESKEGQRTAWALIQDRKANKLKYTPPGYTGSLQRSPMEDVSKQQPEVDLSQVLKYKLPFEYHAGGKQKVVLWRAEIWWNGKLVAEKNSYADIQIKTLKLPTDWYDTKHHDKIEYKY